MKTLRIASCGAGYFSRFQYDAWRRIEGVDLVGIANRSKSTAEAFASEFGIAASFDDVPKMLRETKPDLLDIITPPVTHLHNIKAAADTGVDVICQKPFCEDLVQAKEAIEIAEKAGIKIIIHENFRFQPWYGAIKRVIEGGRLGQLYTIQYRLRPGDGQGAQAYLERQPYFQTMPRFMVHETGIHLIDVFRCLFGSVRSVYADLRKINPAITGEDAGHIIFGFENNARGVFDGNRNSDHAAYNRRLTMGELLVEGEKGVVTLDGDGNLAFRAHGSNEKQVIDYQWRDHHFGGDCVFHFQNHVADHYLRGTPVVNLAADYLHNLMIEEAVYRSASEKRQIVFDEAL